MTNESQEHSETSLADEFYDAYVHHSNQLRVWFVAYGIGGPVLIVTNVELWRTLAPTWPGKIAVVLFLLGVVSQILLTMTNKTLMWIIYFGKSHPKVQNRWWYKFSDRLSEVFWLDLVVDFLSIVFMITATVLVFIGVAGSTPVPT